MNFPILNRALLSRKKYLPLCIALVLLSASISAQRAIGNWKLHLPFTSSNSIVDTEEDVFSATRWALFSVDKMTNEVSRYDKTNGLSDIGIDHISYDSETGNLVIIYENSNIDIFDAQRGIANVSDIRDRSVAGDKRIYSSFSRDAQLFLSTGFGIVVYDMILQEFRDTYIIGQGGDEVRVNELTATNASFYAATIEGIKTAPNNPTINLADFNNWTIINDGSGVLPTGECTHIANVEGNVVAVIDNAIYAFDGTNWSILSNEPNYEVKNISVPQNTGFVTQWRDSAGVYQGNRFATIDTSLSFETFNVGGVNRPVQILEADNGNRWIADQWNGLLKYDNIDLKLFQPNGPSSSQAFDIASGAGAVYVAPGGFTVSFNFTGNADGYFVFRDQWWNTTNRFTNSAIENYTDIASVAVRNDGKQVAFGSYKSGLILLENGVVTTYDKTNSGLQSSALDTSSTRITGLAYDSQGNLWISNYLASNPLVVRKTDGTWQTFNPLPGSNTFKSIYIDSYDQKWLPIRGGGSGILVFDEGDDMLSQADDLARRIQSGAGLGNLPNTNVWSIVEDRDGEVWVGTDEGVAVFFCAASILTQFGCDAQQIIVERDGFNEFLFETEIVKSIAVDGGDRKWIGSTNGVWLISPDGTREIERFNVSNSPLPSDDITDIEINGENGEVFIGTELGLISFLGEAIDPQPTHSDVLVFPNPVKPGYRGPIAIKGLVEDAFVKITDISGGLIFEGEAFGGQAIWNGENYEGERAKSGVYLVFSSNPDGTEKYVAKIVLIN